MATTYTVVFICFVLCDVYLAGGVHLDDYIRHYEAVNYATGPVHEAHLRHKRSIDDTLHMSIDAFDRTFQLRLRRDTSIFHPDYKHETGPGKLEDIDVSFIYSGDVKGPGKLEDIDVSFIYSGDVKDAPGSRVNGAIIQGSFRGTIHIPAEQETYHVEKSYRFFQDQPVFHSVIYRESDMDLDPYKERRVQDNGGTHDPGTCGNGKARAWMREVVASQVIPDNRAKRSALEWQEVASGHNKYESTYNKAEEEHTRWKRKAIVENNTCNMYLRSDIKFWEHYLSKSNNNEEVAKDEILAFFSSHVAAINQIYENTNFSTYPTNSQQHAYTGVKFVVSRTLVLDEALRNNVDYQPFYGEHLDVSNFLNLNSLANHDEFCLAYMFTFRDFSAGTLGLAWVASPGKPVGGICERYKRFNEGGKPVDKSLNTGIVTTLNYGKEVPNKVSQLTFGHEVGHNFGSPHDTGIECAPYGTTNPGSSDGNYIMFASATMGDKPHNNHFSVCSKDNVTLVLHGIFTSSNKYNCFRKSGPFCGNNLVEVGEECDCGYTDQCNDLCCTGRSSTGDNSNACLRSATSVCSPSQGPCCHENSCSFVTVPENKTCRYEQDCAAAATCSGAEATCPASTLKANGEYCNNFGFTCIGGECGGSLCEKFGWTECFLTGKMDSPAEQEKLCTLGCQQNATSTCVLSSESDKLLKYPAYLAMVNEVLGGRGVEAMSGGGVQMAPGSPCNNLQGYCDVFFRCRGVDAEGPLSRLKNLIFSPETLETVKDWIVENWWAVLLMAIGLVVAMGIFIKFCAVHTPSSNPKAKPARKLSETMTLRRRRNQHNQQQQGRQQDPQQVRYPQQKKPRDKQESRSRQDDYRQDDRNRQDYRHDDRNRQDYRHDDRSRDYRLDDYYRHDNRQDQGYRQDLTQEPATDNKYPAKNPQGPPPPYPGSSNMGEGPPHGHGKKGKGRKGRDLEMGKI